MEIHDECVLLFLHSVLGWLFHTPRMTGYVGQRSHTNVVGILLERHVILQNCKFRFCGLNILFGHIKLFDLVSILFGKNTIRCSEIQV